MVVSEAGFAESSAENSWKFAKKYVLLRQERVRKVLFDLRQERGNPAESLRKCHGNLRNVFCNK